MRTSKLGTGTAAALFAAMMAAGCAEGGGGELGADTFGGDVTGVSLSLTTVPADAKCYRATFTAGGTSVVKTIAPTAGSTAPVAFTGGLTSGTTYALTLDVFDLVCGSIIATTPVAWTGSAASVPVVAGALTPVTLVLRRPAGTAVTVDYDSSIGLSQAPGIIYDIAVLEPWVYAARGALLERVPVTGGGAETFATGSNITDVAVEAQGVYFTDSAGGGLYWVPPGQPKKRLTTKAPYSLARAGGVLTAFATTNGDGVVELYTPVGAIYTLASALYAVNKVLSEGGYAIWLGSAVSGPAGINRVMLTGISPATLYVQPTGTSIVDIAADTTHVYFSQSSTPGSNNAILRVPLTATTASPIATVAAGTPGRLLVDGTNVYYMVNVTNAQGTCTSTTINKVPKAGGTVTPLWNRTGAACASAFAQSATQLFFDQGGDLRRIDK